MTHALMIAEYLTLLKGSQADVSVDPESLKRLLLFMIVDCCFAMRHFWLEKYEERGQTIAIGCLERTAEHPSPRPYFSLLFVRLCRGTI